MYSIKPIPTVFEGTKFRSRLEARWALFFTYLRVPYKYEPKRFDLEFTKYTPDFCFNNRTFIEIKPDAIPNQTLRKLWILSVRYDLDAYLFSGDFYEYPTLSIFKFGRDGTITFDYDFRYCPKCKALKLDNVDKCRVCGSELVTFTYVKEKVKNYCFKDTNEN